jgi:hypothetical protein
MPGACASPAVPWFSQPAPKEVTVAAPGARLDRALSSSNEFPHLYCEFSNLLNEEVIVW